MTITTENGKTVPSGGSFDAARACPHKLLTWTRTCPVCCLEKFTHGWSQGYSDLPSGKSEYPWDHPRLNFSRQPLRTFRYLNHTAFPICHSCFQTIVYSGAMLVIRLSHLSRIPASPSSCLLPSGCLPACPPPLWFLSAKLDCKLWLSWESGSGGTALLHCTALHCTALHCTALHCCTTALKWDSMYCTAKDLIALY